MKRFTFMMMAALLSVMTFARSLSMGLVTPPQTAEPVEYFISSGSFYVNGNEGWEDYTKQMKSVKVIVDGSDIYMAGLAYYAKNAWIKGTINGNTATFPSMQQVDEDAEYPEWISGSNDGESIVDIVFTFDQEAGTLTSQTKYIGECAKEDKFSVYAYWLNPAFSKELIVPTPVALPEGAQLVEYVMSSTNYSKEAQSNAMSVAVVGDDVYFKGFSSYLPDALIKGKKVGNTVTFPGNQFLGTYSNYDSYFVEEAVFTYDPETESYSATGDVYSLLGNRYIDVWATNPVLTKVNEIAAVPATPSITGIEESQYGDVMNYFIPLVDINGKNMSPSKLSYQFFIDDENTLMEFTPEYFSRLTEKMTVIPYGFSDNYDIYDTSIYLNMPHDTWQKIGVQSIYTGGGVENKSEIFWFDMPVKAVPVEAPEGLETETYMFTANAQEYSSKGDIEHPGYSIQVQVGFDGDDAYIQGLAADMPELWVKATKNAEGKYVIPANQFMGELEFWGFSFPYYWTAIDADKNMIDAVLNFNAETNTFTTSQTLALNGAADSLDYYMLYNDVVISKFIEVAATPADPIFEKFNKDSDYPSVYMSIPAVDTEGKPLLESKLFYTIWIEKDGQQKPYVFTSSLYSEDFDTDVTEVPYSYDGYDFYRGGEIVYFEETLNELDTWTDVGVQSIYYGADERRTSNIVWNKVTGINNIAAENTGKVTIYNLAGQRVNSPKKGNLYIMNGKKVMMK